MAQRKHSADHGTGSTASLIDSAPAARTEQMDGMIVEWDVPLEMADGVVLKANVYRPIGDGQYPVLMSYGPYGKDLSFEKAYPTQFSSLVQSHPEVLEGSSGVHMSWEVADPERWVPLGYALVRVDSRGSGRSPGYIDSFSAQEARDYYECIEWAGTQHWSTGKVGLCGVSYYAMNQWQVAALQPPHLAAICPWEGLSDWYRDANRHGGIPSSFFPALYRVQIESVQHGLGSRGGHHPLTGLPAAGDVDLSDEELAANRADVAEDLSKHPLRDSYHEERSADLSRVKVPVLSAANWGGQSLHLRGNLAGYTDSASSEAWLEVHGDTHWAHFYTAYGVDVQRRFFDYYLKGEGDWAQEQPRVSINVRHPGDVFELRGENEWPIARTRWEKLYLDVEGDSLSPTPLPTSQSRSYEPFGEGVTMLTAPLEETTEITGPLAAKLWISSASEDADIFLVLHLFDPEGAEVHFTGASEPKQPLSQGWLRASHRRLDPDRSLPYQPVQSHDVIEPLTPGEIYELDLEVWPTCIVAPAGYRIGLSVLGRDYDHGGPGIPTPYGIELRGCGANVHDDPNDRPETVYGQEVTLHSGGEHDSYLLLPVIPQA